MAAMISKTRLFVQAAGITALVILGVGSIPVAYACEGDACSIVSINGTQIRNNGTISKVKVTACWYLGGKCFADGKKLDTTIAPGGSAEMPALKPSPPGGAPYIKLETANKAK